tara:strand:+ start:829 stop:1830 length:1002 start_codon:yes stop_codon:yes gene_type:complete
VRKENEMENQEEKVEVEAVEQEGTPVETEPKKEAKKEELEIEVVDDTPAEDRGRKSMKVPPKEPSEDEVKEYNAKVQKRIDEMKRAWHDERREKEKAFREQQEAINYAKQIKDENEKLKQKLSDGEKTLMEQSKQKAETSIAMAKKNLVAAQETGDAEKITQAMADLTQQNIELENWKRYVPQYDKTVEKTAEKTLQEEKKELPLNQPVQEPAPPDEKAMAWYNKNKWFGVDDELTSFAYGLHTKLVKDGTDPRSDEYYERIDSRLRQVFPEKFDEEPQKETTSQQQKTVVAPATRTTPSKKITLTKSQVAIARKLGVPLEVYAKQVALQEKR